jgi:hypothetical protein
MRGYYGSDKPEDGLPRCEILHNYNRIKSVRDGGGHRELAAFGSDGCGGPPNRRAKALAHCVSHGAHRFDKPFGHKPRCIGWDVQDPVRAPPNRREVVRPELRPRQKGVPLVVEPSVSRVLNREVRLVRHVVGSVDGWNAVGVGRLAIAALDSAVHVVDDGVVATAALARIEAPVWARQHHCAGGHRLNVLDNLGPRGWEQSGWRLRLGCAKPVLPARGKAVADRVSDGIL